MHTNRRVSLLRCMALLACLGNFVGCSDSQPRAKGKPVDDSQAGVVLGSANKPFVIELGNVPMDSSHSRQVPLLNGTSSPIRIDDFVASCECTSVAGLPVDVPPGGTEEITLATDLGKEPGYTGGLGITVELRSGGTVKGVAEVHCNVAKPDKGKS